MTINEATQKYQYDVSLNYIDLESNGNPLWYWDINGGYSSVGARKGQTSPHAAYEELLEFLKTFEPFEK